MTVNDGEMGEVKVSVNIDTAKVAATVAKKKGGKAKKGPAAAAAKRAGKLFF